MSAPVWTARTSRVVRVNGEMIREPAHGVRLRSASIRVPVWLTIIVVTLRTLFRLGFAIGRRPWLWVPLVLVWAIVGALGITGAVVASVLLGVVLTVWARVHRSSFEQMVRWPLRSAWRSRIVYRREWQPAMVTCGLDEYIGDRQWLPSIVAVRSTRYTDQVVVRMLPGQILDDWAERAERLAVTLGAIDCRVRTGTKRGQIVLWFLARDPLAEDVELLAPAAAGETDFAALPVAITESGTEPDSRGSEAA